MVEIVAEWCGLSSLTNAFLAFRNSLITLQTTGALPGEKVVIQQPKPFSPKENRKKHKMENGKRLLAQ